MDTLFIKNSNKWDTDGSAPKLGSGEIAVIWLNLLQFLLMCPEVLMHTSLKTMEVRDLPIEALESHHRRVLWLQRICLKFLVQSIIRNIRSKCLTGEWH